MRTDEEIIARIDEVKGTDFFGVEVGELLIRLNFEKAKPFLKPEAPEEDWTPLARDRDTIIAEMKAYLGFAQRKIDDERGLSAERSMGHYTSWVWLTGDDLGDLGEYHDYGQENLNRIREHYDLT